MYFICHFRQVLLHYYNLYNRTYLSDLLKAKSSLKADGSLMQCKSDAERSYGSFLHHLALFYRSHLSVKPFNVKIQMLRSDRFDCVLPFSLQASAYISNADVSISSSSWDRLFGDADRHLLRITCSLIRFKPPLVRNRVLSVAEKETAQTMWKS